MGDRSDVFFRNGMGGIGVYSHWQGLHMADAVAAVFQSKAFLAALGDGHVATRIGVQIVLETLGARSTDGTQSFALWTPADAAIEPDHPWIVVDVRTREVFVTTNWVGPKASERVRKPTAEALRKRMVAVKAAWVAPR